MPDAPAISDHCPIAKVTVATAVVGIAAVAVTQLMVDMVAAAHAVAAAP